MSNPFFSAESSEPMRVIYDISLLGLNHRAADGRGGVFRTVETLAQRLREVPECALTFSATQSYKALQQAQRYLEQATALQGIPLLLPYSRTGISLGRQIERIIRPTRFQQPVVRRGLSAIYNRFEDRFPRVAPQSLVSADIFHSPFYAIPPQAHNQRRMQKFLTVYDLIPILFPQYVSNNAVVIASFKAILASLRPDSWALCISESARNDLCAYLPIALEQTRITYLAADPDLFYPCTDPTAIAAAQRKYGIPAGPYLLSVNTLAPHKNMEHALRAFARLVQEQSIPDLCFVLVGARGWDYSTIFDTIAHTPGLAARVIVTGYVADGDLAALYSGALAFVYPSLYEGFGLPPLEAMQCGVPVVTSNTAALPEVVGAAGLLVDPRDEDALCQALWTLYRDADQRAALAAAGLARARRFSWDQTLAQTRAAYHEALDAR